MKIVLDTNVILYHLGGRLAEPLPVAQFFVSVISEMELLSYPSLSAEEEKAIKLFLDRVTLVELTPNIRQQAIQLRRDHHLKLPDAIIVATAKEHQAQLLTLDHQLTSLPGITCVKPTLVSDRPKTA